ncbi:MAG: hypothetical protein VCA74_02730 [Deltaproteobacteria bacterium]|jgi:hypothetical protein
MSLFGKTSTKSVRGRSRVVVTGKRINGSWTMESRLPLASRISRATSADALGNENRRVRTLH